MIFGAVSILWGTPYPFIKIAVTGGVTPGVLAWGRRSRAERAVVITYINPIVAVALGVTILGEHPGAGAVAGVLLILAGSWLSTDGRLPPALTGMFARPRKRRGEVAPRSAN